MPRATPLPPLVSSVADGVWIPPTGQTELARLMSGGWIHGDRGHRKLVFAELTGTLRPGYTPRVYTAAFPAPSEQDGSKTSGPTTFPCNPRCRSAEEIYHDGNHGPSNALLGRSSTIPSAGRIHRVFPDPPERSTPPTEIPQHRTTEAGRRPTTERKCSATGNRAPRRVRTKAPHPEVPPQRWPLEA